MLQCNQSIVNLGLRSKCPPRYEANTDKDQYRGRNRKVNNEGSALRLFARALIGLMLLQRQREAQLFLPLRRPEEVILNVLEFRPFKLAGNVPVDYVVDRDVKFLLILGVGEQTYLNLLLLSLSKFTKQVLI